MSKEKELKQLHEKLQSLTGKRVFYQSSEPKPGDLIVFEDAAGKTQEAIFLGVNQTTGLNRIRNPRTGMIGETSSKIRIAESVDKTVKEGTWALSKNWKDFSRAKTELEAFKNKYYNLIGDDLMFDGIDNAIRRIEELEKIVLKK